MTTTMMTAARTTTAAATGTATMMTVPITACGGMRGHDEGVGMGTVTAAAVIVIVGGKAA